MHEYNLPACKCLDCGELLDAATETVGGTKPQPGDATVCSYCGHLMAFAADLTLRPLTDAEMHAIAGDKLLLRVQRALAAVKS